MTGPAEISTTALSLSQKFKIILWVVAVFTSCWTVAGIFAGVIFQYVPIRSDWDPSIKGCCVDVEAELMATRVLNFIPDLLILGLPIPFL